MQEKVTLSDDVPQDEFNMVSKMMQHIPHKDAIYMINTVVNAADVMGRFIMDNYFVHSNTPLQVDEALLKFAHIYTNLYRIQINEEAEEIKKKWMVHDENLNLEDVTLGKIKILVKHLYDLYIDEDEKCE